LQFHAPRPVQLSIGFRLSNGYILFMTNSIILKNTRFSMTIAIAVFMALVLIAPLAVHAQNGDQAASVAKATFAGGCFWCMEPPYDELEGVLSTISGYSGGTVPNPTYKQVSSGRTGHTEVIQIEYDPSRISYQDLLDVFWRNVDPVDAGGQFCDRGDQYRTAIFYHDEQQRRLAERSKETWDRSGKLPKAVVTEIVPFTAFYAAEEYHQDYYQKNPLRYKYYRTACGRDRRLNQLWGEE
jgi:peptide-methionine (S)-S-oxide reductase